MSNPRNQNHSLEEKKPSTNNVSTISVFGSKKNQQQLQIDKYKNDAQYFNEDYLKNIKEYPVSLLKVSLAALRPYFSSVYIAPEIANIINAGKNALNNLKVFTTDDLEALVNLNAFLYEDVAQFGSAESQTAAKAINYLILVIRETFFPQADNKPLVPDFFKSPINLSQFSHSALENESLLKIEKNDKSSKSLDSRARAIT